VSQVTFVTSVSIYKKICPCIMSAADSKAAAPVVFAPVVPPAEAKVKSVPAPKPARGAARGSVKSTTNVTKKQKKIAEEKKATKSKIRKSSNGVRASMSIDDHFPDSIDEHEVVNPFACYKPFSRCKKWVFTWFGIRTIEENKLQRSKKLAYKKAVADNKDPMVPIVPPTPPTLLEPVDVTWQRFHTESKLQYDSSTSYFSFLLGQLEDTPTTKVRHVQGVFELHRCLEPLRVRALFYSALGVDADKYEIGVFLKPARGDTVRDNIPYCTKRNGDARWPKHGGRVEGTIPLQFGQPNGSSGTGAAGDLAMRDLLECKSKKEMEVHLAKLRTSNVTIYSKYRHVFREVIEASVEHRKKRTEAFYIWGKAASVKTGSILKSLSNGTVCMWTFGRLCYKGEDNIVFDDTSPPGTTRHVELGDWKRYGDMHPLDVGAMYSGTAKMVASNVLQTSNYTPEEVYPEILTHKNCADAFYRRTWCFRCDSIDEEPVCINVPWHHRDAPEPGAPVPVQKFHDFFELAAKACPKFKLDCPSYAPIPLEHRAVYRPPVAPVPAGVVINPQLPQPAVVNPKPLFTLASLVSSSASPSAASAVK